MARIPGRNPWLAWPAGIVCAAVVATLAWLALPMVPVVVAWVGESLRTATSPPVAAPVEPSRAPLLEIAESDDAIDCRRLYPDDLWVELAWRPEALLSQDFSAPSTSVASLTDALAPQVRVTCRWRFDGGGGISSTLARVASDSAAVVEAALQGEGFSCETAGAVLRCRRAQGGAVEEHAVSGDLWLSSVETGRVPEDYGARLAEGLWGAG
ncbi:hypothetical protein [Microbacterium ulmi]|uniref:Uncharacterized protein n=1 Tax=Microbacterium ulmi TaxID=179095 RepID=A0A7Y2M238_9MICO|nr:hypothetical protein [Microbacterium ulmi]NII70088.1 hypothetical protein [Microbacterium ulmi]NNH05101.1 hypothetical protein [Microbacterium ulmi]